MKKTFALIVLSSLIGIHCFAFNFQTEVQRRPNAGEVSMKTGKMMHYKDGQWVQMDEDVTIRKAYN